MFSILQENSFQSSMCEKSNHSISVIGKIAFIICLLKIFCNHSQKHINVTSHPCPTPINHSWYLGIRHNRLNRELVIKKKKRQRIWSDSLTMDQPQWYLLRKFLLTVEEERFLSQHSVPKIKHCEKIPY